VFANQRDSPQAHLEATNLWLQEPQHMHMFTHNVKTHIL
jgi:hypothetical protein